MSQCLSVFTEKVCSYLQSKPHFFQVISIFSHPPTEHYCEEPDTISCIQQIYPSLICLPPDWINSETPPDLILDLSRVLVEFLMVPAVPFPLQTPRSLNGSSFPEYIDCFPLPQSSFVAPEMPRIVCSIAFFRSLTNLSYGKGPIKDPSGTL